MPSNLHKSIVFISGAFISNDCWNEWKNYFESKGYNCVAPCWPYKDGSPEELRNRHPDAANASNRLAYLLDYYEIIANSFDEKPILIGHSLGGLVVQLLLQRGLGAIGVAIHSFPPKGVKTISFLKALWKPLGFFTSTNKTFMIPFKKWAESITNGLTSAEQERLYDRYAIPESKLVVRDAFRSIAKINFKTAHPPILLTSGGLDQLIPASLNYKNYERYQSSDSVAAYKEFANHNHFVFDHTATREEADYIFRWLREIEEK